MSKVYFVISVLAIISFCGCKKENSGSTQNEPAAVTYKEIPCHGEGLEKTNANSKIGLTWSLNNSKLNLIFNYTVTCGSAFKDSITYFNNILSINIKNTSSQHSKCICEHGSRVEMNVGSENKIRIIFSVMGYTHNTYSLELDTLLAIR